MKKRSGFLICLCGVLAAGVLLASNISARAATSSEIRDQINAMEDKQAQLQDQMQQLEEQLVENMQQIDVAISQKHTIDQQIALLYTQIDITNEQIAAYNVLISDKQEELERAEERLADLNEKYKVRIRAMEEDGELSYWAILFRAGSFSDFLDRLDMVQEIAGADRRRLQQLSEAARIVTEAKNTIAGEKALLECKRRDLVQMETDLSEKQTHAAELLRQLLAQGDAYDTLLEQSEEEQHKLMQDIAKLEDDYDEAAYQEWLATYVPPTTAPAQATPPQTDTDWLTPVSGYWISSPFGNRLHPILGYERPHQGVDMACAENTPIYATRGGKITIAVYSESAGNYVQINHGDGYSSVYMHMTRYVVSPGEYVAQGQLIGYVGNTGLSKGNHLHFGISYNGEYVNPMEYIG